MKLIIPAEIEAKLHAYVMAVDAEIAGMGKIEVRDDGNAWVTDIAIYEQEVTGATADLSSQSLAFFLTDLVRRGESPKQWILWWHSHNTMSAFFSGTDTGTIDSSDEFDHLISLVVNKRRERKARLDFHRVNGMPIRVKIEEMPIEIPGEMYRVPPEIQAEVNEKVKIKKVVYPTPYGGYSGSGGLGFGKNNHHHGDRAFLEEPLDPTWSKNRKKSGTVTTTGRTDEVEDTSYDEDEILAIIQNLELEIRAHEGNGNGESAECIELRSERDGWYQMLVDLYGTEEGTYPFHTEEIMNPDSEDELREN